MESLLELKQIMTHLIENHQQLIDLAKQKQIVLVEGKVSELQNILIKENKNIDLIQNLEERRIKVVKGYVEDNSDMHNSLTMDQFIKLLKEPELKEWFETNSSQLINLIQELSLLNQNNQELIQMNLSYIQYSINILIPKEQSIGYGKKSQVRSAKLLDAKI